ncbi:hypothetical protein LTR97_004106 [Elasticomyces elasticus]|uniref:NAD(P)-binding domain-containing protein n=1 Tax=Elasticomyces elasticus TaxID=574655 RepID=A0AAN7ZPI7_9PEZI|nr:hypothetical protein LTR97_004106 [Elasticomyces elasticus]
MAAPIKTVALCSPTGKLGPFLLDALKAEGFTVTAVLRKSSKASFPSGQKIVRVGDEYPDSDMIEAFKGQDAVVLSLNFEMLSQATRIAQASLAAGSHWLIASTYGANLQDPRAPLFPASVPHQQAVEGLRELQEGRDTWAWTSISCGPWAELTAELIDEGRNIFSASTREQVARAAARVLKKQPASAKNASIYVASFEADMKTWLDAHKQILGPDDWKVTNADTESMLQRSQAHFGAGEFMQGYTTSALAVCTGTGFQNHFSKFATLANDELDLPKEDLVEVVRGALLLRNPYP